MHNLGGFVVLKKDLEYSVVLWLLCHSKQYLEASWPRRSCGPAPCQPCWWAGTSWWPQCRVGSASDGSKALGAQHPGAGGAPVEAAHKLSDCHTIFLILSVQEHFQIHISSWPTICIFKNIHVIVCTWISTWSGDMPATDDFPPPPPPVLLLLPCFLPSWRGAALCSRSLEALSLSLVPVRRLSRRKTRPRSLRTPWEHSRDLLKNIMQIHWKIHTYSLHTHNNTQYPTHMQSSGFPLAINSHSADCMNACVIQEVWKQKCGRVLISSCTP